VVLSLLMPHKTLRYPTVIIPNLFLALGLLSPWYFMTQLAIPGKESMSPFDYQNTVTGYIHRDYFWFFRLSRWYNYQAISNPIGGPLVCTFAILGMLFAHKAGTFFYLRIISFAGVFFIHARWVAQVVQLAYVEHVALPDIGSRLFNDMMATMSDTPAMPGLHNGTKGYMPASYTVDYVGMIGVALVYALFEAPGILGKIKAVIITVTCGGGVGLMYAVQNSLLFPESGGSQRSNKFLALVYLSAAVVCIATWLPFQMHWIDFAVTPHGRLNGGLINSNVQYATLSVVVPYFALCAMAIAFYNRQKMPTLTKGVLYFNASAFLFFHIAAASAIMLGMACFWGKPELRENDQTQPLQGKKEKRETKKGK